MTATEQWLTDGLKGGWLSDDYKSSDMDEVVHGGIMYYWHTGDGEVGEQHHQDITELLLKPDFWQAVGKTRGWREKTENTFEAEHTCWQAYWTGFYGHLADGLTIEEALTLLT